MRFVRGFASLVLRGGAALAAAWAVVMLFDGRRALGILSLVAAFVAMIAGTALRERGIRADLSDALYTSGDDMLGYRSHLRRRHRG